MPAAIIEVGDMDSESMNGGARETPEDEGATAERQDLVSTSPYATILKILLKSSRESMLPCMKSKCNRA